MLTTLELDDDIVEAAERLAKEQGTTVGQVVSDLARRSLGEPYTRNGVTVFTRRRSAVRATPELVKALQEDE